MVCQPPGGGGGLLLFVALSVFTAKIVLSLIVTFKAKNGAPWLSFRANTSEKEQCGFS